jgi:hypothetical protein
MTKTTVRLGDIAHGRSGDKGDMVNIALICHEKEWLPLLESAITPKYYPNGSMAGVRGLLRFFQFPE